MRNRYLKRPLALGTAILVLASCNDEMTAPEAPESVAPDAPELATATATVNRWATKADMPSTERYSLTSAVVENSSGQSIFYAIGGTTGTSPGASLSKVQAYNAATNTWTYKASLPTPLYWTNGAGVINGKIYVSGGLSRYNGYEKGLYMYDPAKNTWTRKRDMPTTSFRGVTGVFNNKLYVVTQCDQENCDEFVNSALYSYDPTTDQWTTLTAPPGHFGWAQGGFIGGKFYVTGRENGKPSFLAYDPATDQWTRKTPLNRDRWLGSGVAVAGKLYVIGGMTTLDDGSNPVVRTVSVYDPATDSWTNKAPLPNPRSNLTASRVRVNGQQRIQLVGGPRPGNNLQYTP
ncbi:MAG TPA: kelch repeat-containing protein [Gemmatimonadales bacterium]|nr:kelch repeat-containing protein [Gemmatimonadales bacterium]